MSCFRVVCRVAGLVASALLVGVPEAGAQTSQAECRPNPHLARAKDEYDRLEFDRAARTLQRAIEYSKNCKWDLAEVYRLKAFVDAVNAERERCQRAFEILLALDPDYVMPTDVPPKIRTCFEDALQVAPSRRKLELVHRPPEDVTPNAPVSLAVDVIDPLRLVDQVQVYFRREGVSVYTTVTTRADDQVSLVIPALSVSPDPEGYAMEYFVRAVDRWEGTLAEAGSPREPLTFRVQKGRTQEPIYAKWWFWTLIGVGVAGGVGTAVAISATSGDDITLDVNTTTAGAGP